MFSVCVPSTIGAATGCLGRTAGCGGRTPALRPNRPGIAATPRLRGARYAALVAAGSPALTVGIGRLGGPDSAGTCGLLESVALPVLLSRAVGAVPGLRTAEAVAAIAIPLRRLPRSRQTGSQTASPGPC
ncbi:hypothetical protein GCM10010276_38120 [Streptomyces longisporus]|uniref:Uncharacterized protein n=1 Tax=Streptomyces longisporus TaxID=1948 RepID=A0ABN3M5V0_STRLO